MAAETPDTLKFEIDGTTYMIPPLDDMDMDEWQIIYDYSGLVLEDFAPAPDRKDEQVDGDEDGPLEQARQRRLNTPAFTTALLHIGYRRTHPDAKFDTVKKLVGATKRLHVLEAMAESAGEGDAPVPLDVTPALGPSSPREKDESSAQGLSRSPSVSGAPGLHRVPTGTSG